MNAVIAWYPLLLVAVGSPQGPRDNPSTDRARTTGHVPFYVEQTETMGTKKTTYVLARQSDGTTVRIEKGDKSAVRDVFHDDGTAVSVFDTFKAKVTWPGKVSRQGVEAEPLPGCDVNHAANTSDQPAGVESVLGQVVAVTETTMGGIVITSWRAPGLDCEELYYRSEVKQTNGSRKLVVEMTTSVLLLGDPDPVLFIIDPSFVEVPPPSRILTLVGSNGLPLPEDERERLNALARETARRKQ
ncbi:MAG TPA: hypothetical protein VKH42_02835 [Vicinamibacterales bacterium]|nr:hypothetical protein [Vicinamibacterales bacterium]